MDTARMIASSFKKSNLEDFIPYFSCFTAFTAFSPLFHRLFTAFSKNYCCIDVVLMKGGTQWHECERMYDKKNNREGDDEKLCS